MPSRRARNNGQRTPETRLCRRHKGWKLVSEDRVIEVQRAIQRFDFYERGSFLSWLLDRHGDMRDLFDVWEWYCGATIRECLPRRLEKDYGAFWRAVTAVARANVKKDIPLSRPPDKVRSGVKRLRARFDRRCPACREQAE